MGGGNGVRHSRRGAVFAITSLSLCCSVLGGCASAPPSIGLFEDGTEIFYGDAAPVYDSDARLFVGTGRFYFRGSESGLECEGRTAITHVPAAKTCSGYRGKVTAQCGDARLLEATWSASSCKSGFGKGRDNNGTAFAYTFGVPESGAIDRIERELGLNRRRPAWPRTDHAK